MNRPAIFSRVLLLLSLLGLPAQAQSKKDGGKPKLKTAIRKMQLNDGDTLVFLGDSITHQCLYTQYVEDFFYTRHPNIRIRFHNAGVGGAQAWDALQRFDKDVARYKAKYVTILLGMNDGRYRAFDGPIFATYRKDMKEVLARIVKSGAQPILMTPTMFDSRAVRLRRPDAKGPRLEFYNSVLAYYGAWLREVAVESGFGFVNMYSRLNNITAGQRKTKPNFTLIRDAVHPDAPGQFIMAFSILEDMRQSRLVGNARLVRRSADRWQSFAKNGELSDIKSNDQNGVSFTWTGNSLPLVVPAEAQLGAKLVGLNRMNREMIEIHGLQPGQYQLTIDGKSVGVYNANQLAKHIELQNNRFTPQYQQALQVALLNKKRNEGPVRKLRGQWSQFQRYARIKRQAGEQPKNKKLAEQLKQAAKQIEGMGERVAQFESEARKIEDEIFKINQPKSRKYVFKKVRLEKVQVTVTLKGKPAVGVQVVLTGSGLRRGGKADDAGEVRWPRWQGFLPGKYQLIVRRAGKVISKKGAVIQVRADEENDLRVDLK